MKRRAFLGAMSACVGAAFAAPILPATAGKVVPTSANPLFRAEIGNWEGVRIYRRMSSVALLRDHTFSDRLRLAPTIPQDDGSYLVLIEPDYSKQTFEALRQPTRE